MAQKEGTKPEKGIMINSFFLSNITSKNEKQH